VVSLIAATTNARMTAMSDTNPFASPRMPVPTGPLPSDELSVTYILSEDDVVTFNQDRDAHLPTFRRQIRIGRLRIPAVLLAIATLLWFESDSFLPRMIATELAAFGILVVIFWPWWYRRAVGKNTRRMLASGKNIGLIGQHWLSLGPDQIVASSPYSEAKLRWPLVEQIILTDDQLLIYISSMSALIIPRREFASDEHARAFYDAACRFRAAHH